MPRCVQLEDLARLVYDYSLTEFYFTGDTFVAWIAGAMFSWEWNIFEVAYCLVSGATL